MITIIVVMIIAIIVVNIINCYGDSSFDFGAKDDDDHVAKDDDETMVQEDFQIEHFHFQIQEDADDTASSLSPLGTSFDRICSIYIIIIIIIIIIIC